MKAQTNTRRTGWLAVLTLLTTLIAARAPAQVGPGSALTFDGLNDYAYIGSPPLSNSWTLELWVNRQSSTNWAATLLDDGVTSVRLEQFQYTRLVGFTRYGVKDHTFPYTISPGTWVHLALVSDTNTHLYVDGVLNSSVPSTIELPMKVLGALTNASGVTYPLKASLDEVRIWNVARSAEQIRTNRNRALTGTEPGLVAYWRCDEGAGTTLADATGNGHTATLINGPTWTLSGARFVPDVATNISVSSGPTWAVFTGAVNPGNLATWSWFAWGTTNCDNRSLSTSLAATNASLAVSVGLSNLAPGTIYQFRLVATNGVGTTLGNDLTFRAGGLTNLVTNANDRGPGSLRDVIANSVNGDTVAFAPGLSGTTIMLTSSQISLNQSLTVDGSALINGITIDGNANSRIFEVASDTTTVLNSLTLAHGKPTETDVGGPVFVGGGILNWGNLTVNRCTLTSNVATNGSGGGGAICNLFGALTVNQSTLTGNNANYSAGGGAILSVDGSVTVNQSTLTGNSAVSSAYHGGGILEVEGSLTLYNSIVAGNSASADPEIYCDCGFTALGNSLTSGSPLLAPLGNYGGPTPTMPPLPGSPAIDAGADSATNTFATDQRGAGFPRLSGLHVDVGAVELAYAPGPPLVVTQAATGLGPATAILTASIAPNGAVTACHFEYGLTTSYGSVTATNILRASTAAVAADLAGLPAATQYHFRTVATNRFGTTLGNDLPFHTGGLTNLVNNTNDSGSGSLRDVIANAAAGDTVGFAPGLSGTTIVLTSSQITLDKNLTLDGSALANGITLDGNANRRIFEVSSNRTVVLNSLTVANGKSYVGGGILNWGNLTVNRCTLTGNVATDASGGGGAIWNQFGTLTVNQSTLTGNDADYSQGGGAICNDHGDLTVNQSTLTGNSAVASTLGGGGILSVTGQSFALDVGFLTLCNSIVAGNSASAYPELDCMSWFGPIALGNNLTNGAPLLAPLGNYGGPTPTMPPRFGSPALNAGSDSATNSFLTDQRGHPRLSGAHVDIGAVEAQVCLGNRPLLTGPGKTGNGSFQFAVSNNTPGVTFTVFTTTNLALPFSNWTLQAVRAPIEIAPGQFQFTDAQPANGPRRFYRVTSP